MNINNPCVTVQLVADTSQTVELTSSHYISIYNSGANVCFVKSGTTGVLATITDTFIPPGFSISYKRCSSDTHIAIISDEASKIYVQSGEGV